ncbi:MAG: ABC transporter ATP-binding protein [Halanaerobiales bacterium]|nr:ABC transporter ATP-binding protein [Halanaerobiales bacterium]
MSNNNILEVKDLNVHFRTDEGLVRALNGVSFEVERGQSVGIVGESGCGKSVTSTSVMRLLPGVGEIANGTIKYYDKDNNSHNIIDLEADGEQMRSIRGPEMSMIFQEPMTAFSPVHTIGNQIMEKLLYHENINKDKARLKTLELLKKVGISKPEQRIDEYPFQYSGGMRQRAMIAMGLACEPQLLIADEPTTALDVTIQAQVLKLIKEMQADYNLSLILITHDLGVIAHMVDYVNVMYLGRVVEAGPVEVIFDNPAHPYTQDLLKSIPKMTGNKGKLASIEGSVPDAYSLPEGCPFHTRCRKKIGDVCESSFPRTQEISKDHYVNCFLHQDLGDK